MVRIHFYPGSRSMVLFGFLILLACKSDPKLSMPAISSYTEHFIQTPSARLQYLDWGGSGPPLILLHGLGDSPFIFMDLADTLRRSCRVIACARRGHAGSVATDERYDNTALVGDLKTILDSLYLQKASFLGWSMGGNEITEFAIRYPERTDKLIYLEAGYDMSDPEFARMVSSLPQSLFADSADMSSVDQYRAWYHRFWVPDIAWNPSLEANLQASIRLRPDGSVQAIPGDELTGRILREAMAFKRPYEQLSSPALFFFVHTFFKAPDEDTATVQLFNALEKDLISPWRQKSIERVQREISDAQVEILPRGSHSSLFFLNKDSIAGAILSFLKQN